MTRFGLWVDHRPTTFNVCLPITSGLAKQSQFLFTTLTPISKRIGVNDRQDKDQHDFLILRELRWTNNKRDPIQKRLALMKFIHKEVQTEDKHVQQHIHNPK